MARIKIMPVEPLELEFSDGTIKKALFNNEAFAIFENEFGRVDELAKTEGVEQPYNFAAKMLYSGLKVVDRTITLEEAESIVLAGGGGLIEQITLSMMDNFTYEMSDSDKANFYKEVNVQIEEMTRDLTKAL